MLNDIKEKFYEEFEALEKIKDTRNKMDRFLGKSIPLFKNNIITLRDTDKKLYKEIVSRYKKLLEDILGLGDYVEQLIKSAEKDSTNLIKELKRDLDKEFKELKKAPQGKERIDLLLDRHYKISGKLIQLIGVDFSAYTLYNSKYSLLKNDILGIIDK